ncbi:fluoride efflux transporter CrcB [Bacillus massiliglaciei]|uniref:fluoride efflux transporter CrcB n=1 Tax=Bacillus massiliglaciei TaxID=1816693 RepID=UPI000B33947F|nr:fluoride efflux transporter CrcB [Bacillus massiliglaciei]
MISLLLVVIGGFFGAISRFGASGWIKRKYPSRFPYATLFVNLTGSFLLGLLLGAHPGSSWELLFGTGFLGAFTTFSTFKLENIQLHAERHWKLLVLYLGISYTFGILLAFLGLKIGSAL